MCALRLPAFCLLLVLSAFPASAHAEGTKTENVMFVMMDGLRWQEVFTGAEESLLDKSRGGVSDVDDIREKYWRDSAEERRAALMPFLWNVIAKEGQIYGNSYRQSIARVTNNQHFSYPGYNEVLCGFADPTIDSNAKIYNRNVTMLEWLHKKPEFDGKIAAFASWDVFPFIINSPRSGIPVNAGFAPVEGLTMTPQLELLNQLMTEIPLYGETTRLDPLTFRAAMEYLKEKHPRVLFISFDETDTHGHAGRYDRVLDSAHENDAFVRELWETIQQMPEYKGKTSLVVTTDHGRGDPPVGWKSHSTKIPGSEYIWAAFLGPDTPALGERKEVDVVAQSQIAATIAQLLGYDYNTAEPRAGQPIPDVVEQK